MSFLKKHLKKALLAIALVGAVAAGAGTVNAQMDNGRMIPNNLWRQITTTAIAPISTTLELGSSSIRIAKGWFTALDATTITVGTFTTGLTQGSVVFVGAAGVLAQDNANFFWDDTNNRLGIGTASPSTTLHILVPASASAAEAIATFAVADDSVAKLTISNSTAADNTFSALLTGVGSSTSTSLNIYGRATTDTGTNPVVIFDARTVGDAAIATRPMFSWRNVNVEAMQLDARGRLRMNTGAAYSESGLASSGIMYYDSTSGVLTLAAFSTGGNTQLQLRTAVGSGTNATRFAIGPTGAMSLTPATTLTATTNGSTNLTETASSTHTLIVTRTSTSDANYGIKLTNLGTSGYGSAINWEVYGSSATPNTYSAAQIKVENTGASGGGFLAFLTAPAASTTLAEVARLYNDTFLIGRTSGTLSNGILQVRATASASTAEKIALFDVSDDATGKLEILNLSSTDAVFQPGIRATTASTTEGLGIESAITTDTGSAAGMYFQAKTAAGAALTTRPLFQWLNFGTVVTSVAATGAWNYTKPSQASTAETLATWSVSDDAVAKIDIINGTATDTAFNPIFRGTGGSNRVALTIIGAATTDTGATGVLQLDGRTTGGAAITTRPVIIFTNNNTTIAQFSGSTAGNYFGTSYGRVKAVRSVSSTTITVAVTDHIVLSSTGGGAVAVSLPASPETGREYTIKDNVGDAGTNNITITPAAGNIDGAGTVVINANYGWRTLVYNGTQWNVTGRE